MSDIILAVAIGAITLLTAYLGVHVTLHPPESPCARLWYKVGFSLCAIVACALIGIQAYRNSKMQSSMETRLTTIEQNTKQIGEQEKKVVRPWLSSVATYSRANNIITLQVVNSGPTPAENVHEHRWVEVGHLSGYRGDLFTKFYSTEDGFPVIPRSSFLPRNFSVGASTMQSVLAPHALFTDSWEDQSDALMRAIKADDQSVLHNVGVFSYVEHGSAKPYAMDFCYEVRVDHSGRHDNPERMFFECQQKGSNGEK